MEKAQSDAQLMRLTAERDPRAAAELFARYSDELLAFLRHRASGPEAEDLLQEIFIKLMRSASTFRGDGTVRSWLYTIARRTVIDHQRSRMDGVTFASIVYSGPGPESLAVRAEREDLLRDAFEQLPEKQAIVLELYRIYGFSHPEIARILGIAPAASRKRLERAEQALERAVTTRRNRDGRARQAG